MKKLKAYALGYLCEALVFLALRIVAWASHDWRRGICVTKTYGGAVADIKITIEGRLK
jgi:hypothetical protein